MMLGTFLGYLYLLREGKLYNLSSDKAAQIAMLIYGIVYGSKRFFTVFIRGDHNRGYWGPLSQSQCISIVVVLSCMLLFFLGN